MARFVNYSADEILKEMGYVTKNVDGILTAMTKDAAEYVAGRVRSSVPRSDMASHVKVSRTYKTPSDGGVNNKVYFSGYLPFKGNRTQFARRGKSGGKVYTTEKGVPVEFLAILFEHGRSTSPFPKRPFFRRAFDAKGIEKVMLEAQKRESGGILDDE